MLKNNVLHVCKKKKKKKKKLFALFKKKKKKKKKMYTIPCTCVSGTENLETYLVPCQASMM